MTELKLVVRCLGMDYVSRCLASINNVYDIARYLILISRTV